MKNFKANPNTLSFRTPRWRIKSARPKFINKNPEPYNNLSSSVKILKKLDHQNRLIADC